MADLYSLMELRSTKLTETQYFPIRKKCGMVFQHPALFDSLTIYENIAFGLRKHYRMSEKDITAQYKSV